MVDPIAIAEQIIGIGLYIHNTIEEIKNFKKYAERLIFRIDQIRPSLQILANMKAEKEVLEKQKDTPRMLAFAKSLEDMLKLMEEIQEYINGLKHKTKLNKLTQKDKIKERFAELDFKLGVLQDSISFGVLTEVKRDGDNDQKVKSNGENEQTVKKDNIQAPSMEDLAERLVEAIAKHPNANTGNMNTPGETTVDMVDGKVELENENTVLSNKGQAAQSRGSQDTMAQQTALEAGQPQNAPGSDQPGPNLGAGQPGPNPGSGQPGPNHGYGQATPTSGHGQTPGAPGPGYPSGDPAHAPGSYAPAPAVNPYSGYQQQPQMGYGVPLNPQYGYGHPPGGYGQHPIAAYQQPNPGYQQPNPAGYGHPQAQGTAHHGYSPPLQGYGPPPPHGQYAAPGMGYPGQVSAPSGQAPAPFAGSATANNGQQGDSPILAEKITEQDAGNIAKIIGTQDELTLFYTNLGLKNRDIKAAEKQTDSIDPTTKARNVLLKWRQMNGKSATRQKIINAMKERKWGEDSDEVEELWQG